MILVVDTIDGRRTFRYDKISFYLPYDDTRHTSGFMLNLNEDSKAFCTSQEVIHSEIRCATCGRSLFVGNLLGLVPITDTAIPQYAVESLCYVGNYITCEKCNTRKESIGRLGLNRTIYPEQDIFPEILKSSGVITYELLLTLI